MVGFFHCHVSFQAAKWAWDPVVSGWKNFTFLGLSPPQREAHLDGHVRTCNPKMVDLENEFPPFISGLFQQVPAVSFPGSFPFRKTSYSPENKTLEYPPFEDVFPTENGDFPACHASFPECNFLLSNLPTLLWFNDFACKAFGGICF